jgi:hypothetical protein
MAQRAKYSGVYTRDVLCKMLIAKKFLTAQKGLFLGANRVVVTNVPSRLHSNDVMSFAPRISHFLLKL